MGEKRITSLWECECSSKNPLRSRKCKTCGRDMPEYIANKIYYEELKEQKAFVFIEDQEESKNRCLKIGSFLESVKNIVVPITILIVIAINAGRIYLDSYNFSNYTSEILEDRQERLWCEMDNAKGRMNGLKTTPVVVETIFSDIVFEITNVSKCLSVKPKVFGKNIEYEKIEKIKNKIGRVTEYVTNSFE